MFKKIIKKKSLCKDSILFKSCSFGRATFLPIFCGVAATSAELGSLAAWFLFVFAACVVCFSFLGSFFWLLWSRKYLDKGKRHVLDAVEHRGRSGINQIKQEAEFSSHLSGDHEMEPAPAWMIFRTHIHLLGLHFCFGRGALQSQGPCGQVPSHPILSHPTPCPAKDVLEHLPSLREKWAISVKAAQGCLDLGARSSWWKK